MPNTIRMKYLFLAPCLILTITVAAQPVQVKNIMPDVFSSNPSRLTVFNYRLYFLADDGFKGYELWTHDGINTDIAKDIYQGPTDCAPNSPAQRMAILDNKLYFPADNGTNGLELYSHDGGGTTALESDIATGLNSSEIDEIIAANDKLYFDATNGTNGKELWQYDPAIKTAEQLSFINSGSGSDPDWITEANGKIYFTALDPAKGRELFEYNPATALVTMVADIYPGITSADPTSLVNVFGELYFTAVSSDYGRELYKYDGSGLQRLTDLNGSPGDGLAAHSDGLPIIGVVGDELYFAGNDGTAGFQLFRYNYVSNQSAHVATIHPAGNSTPAGFTRFANKLFFTADDGTHGRELWMKDGNNPPTMVADINTNAAVNIQPMGMVEYKGSLYFSAYGADGNELYKYSDAAAGVVNFNRGIDVKVFPNPAVTEVYFSLDIQQQDELSIRLTDATGKQVYKTRHVQYMPGTNLTSIPVDWLPNGQYFYQVNNRSGQTYAAGRVVKM